MDKEGLLRELRARLRSTERAVQYAETEGEDSYASFNEGAGWAFEKAIEVIEKAK